MNHNMNEEMFANHTLKLQQSSINCVKRDNRQNQASSSESSTIVLDKIIQNCSDKKLVFSKEAPMIKKRRSYDLFSQIQRSTSFPCSSSSKIMKKENGLKKKIKAPRFMKVFQEDSNYSCSQENKRRKEEIIKFRESIRKFLKPLEDKLFRYNHKPKYIKDSFLFFFEEKIRKRLVAMTKALKKGDGFSQKEEYNEQLIMSKILSAKKGFQNLFEMINEYVIYLNQRDYKFPLEEADLKKRKYSLSSSLQHNVWVLFTEIEIEYYDIFKNLHYSASPIGNSCSSFEELV